jgi:phosphopantothenoylcysteine decarboxylase/phosphopantothenate--cysteine ligase
VTDPAGAVGRAHAPRRPEIVLGISGGIAAYKAVEVLRQLTETGHAVTVVPTEAALLFVGEPTWAALSGRPVASDVWTAADEVPHVRLGRAADLVLVVPATADVMARAVAGRADDLLTSTLLTATCPVLFAPAMHTEMWEHPATRSNVRSLRERGAVVIEPASGRLTGADTGPGRLPDPVEIASVARSVLARSRPASAGERWTGWADLTGRRIVVSAGGTREPLDPVRFLGNRSTGRQGYAIARAAAVRGADVTLVSANVELPEVAGVTTLRVRTAADLRDAVLEAASGADAADVAGAADVADVVVMAAAVADFRPVVQQPTKIKKVEGADPQPLQLTRNADVLAELVQRRGASGGTPDRQVIVGFAAETDDVLRHGRTKLARKGCDLLVVNEVGEGRGFEVEHNTAIVLAASGESVEIPQGSKDALAHRLWDLVVQRLAVPGDKRPV